MNLLASIGALAALLLILSGPLPFCAVVLARALPAGSRAVGEQWLAVALLWLACQLSGATLLAAFGYFTLGGVLLWQGLLLGGGLLGGGLLGGGLLGRTNLPNYTSLFAHASLPFWATLFSALLLFGNLLSQPITDYDSLYYHLPFVASLHATGGFTAHAVAAVVAWYPFGWETLSALLVLPLQRDLLVTLPNLLVWGLWGLAIYRLARRLGAPAYATGSVTLLLLTQPLVIDQIHTVRVDLALAAIFSAGLAFTVADWQERERAAAVFAILCLPMLAALKTSGLIYGLLLLILLAFGLRRPRQLSNMTKLIPLLALLGMTSAAAGFWYLNNWLDYGNPLGAVALQFGRWTIFAGEITGAAMRRTMLLTLFMPTDPTHWRALATQLWQQGGVPGALLGLLALALWLPRSLKVQDWRRAGTFVLLYCLLVAIYWVTPYSGDDGSYGYQLTAQWLGQSLRFALAAAGVLAVLAALGGSQLPHAARWLPPLSVTAALLALAQRSTLYLLAAIGFALILAGWYGLGQRRRGLALRMRLQQLMVSHGRLLLAGALLLLLGAGFALRPLRIQRSSQAYGELPQLVERITPVQATIAALYSHQSYLAAGETLQRHVVQVPITIKAVGELRQWLDQQAIDFVILGPLRPQWQAEPLLTELATTNDFTLLYDGSPNHPLLYAVKRP